MFIFPFVLLGGEQECRVVVVVSKAAHASDKADGSCYDIEKHGKCGSCPLPVGAVCFLERGRSSG